MSEDKTRGFSSEPHHHPPQSQQYPAFQYGTFPGVSNYPPPQPQPAIGLPHPVPSPGATEYAHGYHTVPGYAVVEGRPVREPRLPCCGIGCGWFLFIIGFFLAAIPWYVGAVVLLCSRIDYREKPGYIACTVAAALTTIAVILGVTKGTDDW